jgi:hypothetical protein
MTVDPVGKPTIHGAFHQASAVHHLIAVGARKAERLKQQQIRTSSIAKKAQARAAVGKKG